MSDRASAPAPRPPAAAPSAGDVRFESTFSMDDALFQEYFDARDRSLNRRDGLVWSVVFGVVMLCYIWGTVSVWLMTPWGIACGLVILALLVYGIVLAVTGFTLHWPRRSWEKTRRHYFARHGSPNGEPFTLRTSACLSEVRACVLRDGRPKESIAKRYQQFSHVEVTERLVVLVAGDVEVGSILHNLFSSSYAERLEQRADLEDMVFSKADLAGGTPDELVEFLQRKLGHRA